MAFFGNRNSNGVTVNDPYAKYNKSIANLLLVVIFSAVNVVMLATNSGSYFVFSAFMPYDLVDYGMLLCGLYPLEVYEGLPEMELMDISFFYVTIAIAVVIILVYLLCWFLAKKRKVGALIFALVFFVVDTIAMLYTYGFSEDSIIDIVFHAWVIISLAIGVVTYFKVKKAQVENPQLDGLNENQVATENATLNGAGTTSNYEGTDLDC